MKFLFASDSFKESLSCRQTAELLERAAKEVFGEVECVSVPAADGGEGTADALISALDGVRIGADVHDPLGRPLRACYGGLGDRRAVIEMAAASGLALVPREKRDPLYTTSFGTGELIRDALDRGFDDISVAIGGSATNDGGMGCATALGVRFLDKDGCELAGRGIDLEKVTRIDVSSLDPRLKDVKLTVMCDVTNPLCGQNGATYTYGPQKGAGPETLARLEKGMLNYRGVIIRQFGTDPDCISGGGAAGGLGTALRVFLSAEMRPGIDTVLGLIDFDALLDGVDLVVTGEGRTDSQSLRGKVIIGVGERARAKGIPAVALSGSLGPDTANFLPDVFAHGINSVMTSVDAPMSLDEALGRASELYYFAAVRMFRFIRVGTELRHS